MASPITNISLYIPHIFENFSKKDVTEVFEFLKIGKVNNIDFIAKVGKDGKNYNSAYIHFDYWYNNKVSINFHKRVLNPEKEARIVYEDPWYWIVLENKGNKVTPGQRKIRIDLGDLNKSTNKKPCPPTPIKLSNTNGNFNKNITATNLNSDFDECVEISSEEGESLEKNMNFNDEQDNYLAYFDKRYVETIEKENYLFRNQLFQLQNAYYIEQLKSASLEDNIGKSN